MEESTNPSPAPSNRTSSVCSPQAHDDDLSLHAEWSEEDRESQGDGQPRVEPEDREVQEDPENPDDPEEQDEGQGVQEDLLRLSGSPDPAPEILRVKLLAVEARVASSTYVVVTFYLLTLTSPDPISVDKKYTIVSKLHIIIFV